jgi:hypothetical protein
MDEFIRGRHASWWWWWSHSSPAPPRFSPPPPPISPPRAGGVAEQLARGGAGAEEGRARHAVAVLEAGSVAAVARGSPSSPARGLCAAARPSCLIPNETKRTSKAPLVTRVLSRLPLLSIV